MVHFLTQILVESNYFRYLQELGNGAIYEGNQSLGNTQKGDGRRYIGRGYIKILGRKAYEDYSRDSKVDLVNYPTYATTPKVCMDIAGWIWDKKQLNILADQDSLEDVTKILLGDHVMMRERYEAMRKVKQAIGLI